jgi:hypothetical protein
MMTQQHDSTRAAMELLENMFDVEMRYLQSGPDGAEMLASAFHPDVIVHEPKSLPYAGDWKGLEGVGALFRKMREIWSDVACKPRRTATWCI